MQGLEDRYTLPAEKKNNLTVIYEVEIYGKICIRVEKHHAFSNYRTLVSRIRDSARTSPPVEKHSLLREKIS